MSDDVLVRTLVLSRRTRSEHAQILAPKLKALGEPTRLELLLLLAEGARTVKQLQDELGLSQTLVSHHLAVLREQHLVTAVPEGRTNVYSLCCEELGDPVRVLAGLAARTPAGEQACCPRT